MRNSGAWVGPDSFFPQDPEDCGLPASSVELLSTGVRLTETAVLPSALSSDGTLGKSFNLAKAQHPQLKESGTLTVPTSQGYGGRKIKDWV